MGSGNQHSIYQAAADQVLGVDKSREFTEGLFVDGQTLWINVADCCQLQFRRQTIQNISSVTGALTAQTNNTKSNFFHRYTSNLPTDLPPLMILGIVHFIGGSIL